LAGAEVGAPQTKNIFLPRIAFRPHRLQLLAMHPPRTCSLLASLASLTLAIAAPAGFAQRAPVEAERGMVTSAHELASQAGLEMLKKGGNAVDAAVATGLALTVVYPFAGNIGGGGFMMIHLADGRDLAVDYPRDRPSSPPRGTCTSGPTAA
jgi:gamma-glutamyltranspeptidase/glutathione hydrolase